MGAACCCPHQDDHELIQTFQDPNRMVDSSGQEMDSKGMVKRDDNSSNSSKSIQNNPTTNKKKIKGWQPKDNNKSSKVNHNHSTGGKDGNNQARIINEKGIKVNVTEDGTIKNKVINVDINVDPNEINYDQVHSLSLTTADVNESIPGHRDNGQVPKSVKTRKVDNGQEDHFRNVIDSKSVDNNNQDVQYKRVHGREEKVRKMNLGGYLPGGKKEHNHHSNGKTGGSKGHKERSIGNNEGSKGSKEGNKNNNGSNSSSPSLRSNLSGSSN